MHFKKLAILSSIIIILTTVGYLSLNSNKFVNTHKVILNEQIRYQISFDSTVLITLDDLTTAESLIYFQYNPSDSLLYSLNSTNRVIYGYNLASGLEHTKIHLDQFGFDQNDRIQGFHYINSDSLFIYNYNGARLSFIGELKEIKWAKGLFAQRPEFFDKVFPYVTQASPMMYDSKLQKIFLTGFLGDEGSFQSTDSKRKVLTAFDLKSGDLTYTVQYPKFYWGRNWAGIAGFRQPFHTHNPSQHKVVISFLADHNLKVISTIDNDELTVFSGSKFFNEISSMNESSLLFDFISGKDKIEYYYSNSSYTSIIYDQSNKLYYRLTRVSSQNQTSQKTIIVLDEKFEWIQEVDFPEELNQFIFFSTPHGVWFYNDKRSNEGTVVFNKLSINI